MFVMQGIENQQEIPQSAYSIVYSGTDRATEQKVAIKVLKDEFPSLHHIARFHEEYELTCKYEIAGIRKILAIKKAGHRPVLIMEYVEGSPLKTLIENKPLDTGFFLQLTIRLSSIPAEIHQHGIIHKDTTQRTSSYRHRAK